MGLDMDQIEKAQMLGAYLDSIGYSMEFSDGKVILKTPTHRMIIDNSTNEVTVDCPRHFIQTMNGKIIIDPKYEKPRIRILKNSIISISSMCMFGLAHHMCNLFSPFLPGDGYIPGTLGIL